MINKLVNVYLGLGSNLKDPKYKIKEALHKISQVKQSHLIQISHFYLTSPVGGITQNDFINSACMIQTSLSPMKLFEELQNIEKDLGRISRIKNGPREIDIDILFYGNKVIQQEDLVIPHPRWKDRLFVLYPLSDLIKDIHYLEKGSIYSFNLENLIQNFINKGNQKIQGISNE